MASLASGQTGPELFSFGPFRLFVVERRLERNGMPVALGSRAFEILLMLLERAPEVVGKRELLTAVWRDLTVDEGSLRFHVAALRKAMGDGQPGTRYILNVPGRGYCFGTPVTRGSTAQAAARSQPAAPGGAALPAAFPRMVGRDEAARTIAEDLTETRFVTIVGPGGIGKTTLALAVANGLVDHFAGGVHFVDLGALKAHDLVANVVATAVGLAIGGGDPVPALVTFLRDRPRLLVVDTCEHLIETVAPLAERFFVEVPEVHILATSREALRVEGEHVHRLPPLGYPDAEPSLTAEAALAYPAVKLFVDRARASGAALELAETDGQILAAICQRLDGIALALELAAGQLEAHGLRGIAAQLDSQFSLLWRGRRTALPRHQTLSATLDWSYNLLTEPEGAVLRRLAVFAGSFSLDAAHAVAADDVARAQIIEIIAGLVAKSLVVADASSQPLRYRLLDTTRSHARQKLIEAGEEDEAERRRDRYLIEFFRQSIGEDQPYGAYIGDVRTALEWCFSEHGDPEIGVSLVVAIAPAFLDQSLLSECRAWTERALAVLGSADHGTYRELQLRSYYAISTAFSHGHTPDVRAALTRSLELAETLGDDRSLLRQLECVHAGMINDGDWEGALPIALRCESVASSLGDPVEIAIADCHVCLSHFHVGNLAATQRYCEKVIQNAPARTCASMVRWGYDSRLFGLVLLAEISWIQGRADLAVASVRQALSEVETGAHPVLYSACLIFAADTHLRVGDWDKAEHFIRRMADHTEKFLLVPHRAIAHCLEGRLQLARGDTEAGIALLQLGFATLKAGAFRIGWRLAAPELAEALADSGQPEAALAVIDLVLADSPQHMLHSPELLRVKGRLLASSPHDNPAEAENRLQEALAMAQRQGMLSWELRIAMTLARLWREQGRAAEGAGLVSSIYQRFTEGFGTPDLVQAADLLAALGRETKV